MVICASASSTPGQPAAAHLRSTPLPNSKLHTVTRTARLRRSFHHARHRTPQAHMPQRQSSTPQRDALPLQSSRDGRPRAEGSSTARVTHGCRRTTQPPARRAMIGERVECALGARCTQAAHRSSRSELQRPFYHCLSLPAHERAPYSRRAQRACRPLERLARHISLAPRQPAAAQPTGIVASGRQPRPTCSCVLHLLYAFESSVPQ